MADPTQFNHDRLGHLLADGLLKVDGPWGSLWRVINRAEWVAAVGVPLAATLLALFFAAWALRRQLKNDRKLLKASIRAGQRTAAASQLSVELREVYDRFQAEPKQSKYWAYPEWPDRDRLLDAVRRAAYVIEDQEHLNYYRSAIQAIGDIFMTAYHTSRREGWREQWVSDSTARPTEDSHIYAMRDLIDPLLLGMKNAADVLLMWDGHLPLPAGTLPQPSSESREDRRSQYERTSEEYVRNVLQSKLRLYKLPSDPSIRTEPPA